MKNILSRIIEGCILIVSLCFSLQGNSQTLVISGKGKVANAAYWAPYAASGKVYYLFISDEESFVLPYVKPRTKEIRIISYHKGVEFGNLKSDGKSSVVIIKYDIDGNMTEIKKDEYGSGRYKYENGRVIEWSGGDLSAHPTYSVQSRCIYNKNGFLEKQYHRDGQWSTDLYEYKTDSKGNILSAKKYDYAGKAINNSNESYQYDGKGRLVTYKSSLFKKGDYFTNDYSRNIEKKWQYDNKGNMTSLRIKDKVNNRIYDYEYKFEYGKDNNPIRLTRYNHDDVTVIVEGWEYTFTYTFYPDPEEQKQQEAFKIREQKRKDSIVQIENQRREAIQLAKQRKTDSINLENQRKESLRQERNKELFQVCKFLFDSNEEYELCVVKKNDIAEQDIKGRVVKKLQYIYPLVLNGKELRKEKQLGRNELIQICNMCAQLNSLKSQCDNEEIEIINHICDYTESKLGDFVSGRSALNKAYKKASNKNYSSFLLSYMNDK